MSNYPCDALWINYDRIIASDTYVINKKFEREFRIEYFGISEKKLVCDRLSKHSTLQKIMAIKKDNDRIIRQGGAFFITGVFGNDTDAIEESIDKYMIAKIKIPYEYKASILRSLSAICIDKKSLFPELDKIIDAYKEETLANSPK